MWSASGLRESVDKTGSVGVEDRAAYGCTTPLVFPGEKVTSRGIKRKIHPRLADALIRIGE